MWLGIGILGGWLSLTSHHWPPLAKHVTHNCIKGKFEPIHIFVFMCLLIYAYVSMPFSVMCLKHLGDEPQTFLSPFFHSHYLLFENMEHIIFIQGSLISHLLHPPSHSSWAPVNPKLHLRSQPFSCHILGLLPTILESSNVMVSQLIFLWYV